MEKLARVADIDGGLDFVTGEDPELDACLLDVVDSPANINLQFVFDGRRADQFKIDFKLLCDSVDCSFFVDRCCSSLILLLPCLIVIL